MTERWQSYDSVAATYARVAVPAYFMGPARDLIAALELAPGDIVLDVGTGTGAVGRSAMPLVAPGGAVFGVDASPGMLGVARGHGMRYVVAGAVPDLPFANERFHHVVASFLVSHLRSYQECLTEMVRVLRGGGTVAVSAWQTTDDEFRQFWRSVAEPFASGEELREAARQAIPWEDWFADSANMRDALAGVGLTHVAVRSRHYDTPISIADFLSLRETAIPGRFMRANLPGDRWERFRYVVAQEFRSRFSDPLHDARDAHFAVGTKASGARPR